MKKNLKKYLPEILTFIVPILIMLISCIVNKTYPFGNEILPKYDGYYQYAGFTSYYKNVLLGNESLFYSFKGLLGYNFYATSIYYMFNPTNLLCIFSTNVNILEYYTFIILLRIGLSGFTMCKYLKYKFKNQSNLRYIIFSISYALMAYNVCYFFNYMYFDTVVLFPIVVLGLDKLIYERKNRLYIISLTLSIISNFYIGYMVCIFSLLYFIYNIVIYKLDKNIIKDFIISSLLSGFMCMIIIIPEASELLKGKALLYTSSKTEYFKFNMNFLNIFYKFLPGSTSNYDLKYGMVNIYVSLFVIILVIKYFFNKKISKKERITTLIFILFFLLSISFNLLDFAWQLFQRPIWYPNRYIFTFSFFLITIAMKEITNITYKTNIKENLIIIISFILLTLYSIISLKIHNDNLKIISYILGIILILQYTFFLNNKNAKYLLVMLFFIEVTTNAIFTLKIMGKTTTMTQYKTNEEINEKAVKHIKEIENKDNNFYRMELSTSTVHNSPSLLNYNGINHFNSVKNAKTLNFLNKFNYQVTDDTSVEFNNYNPYLTSLLGIKYINGSKDEMYYENVYNENPYMYLNKDALSLGYMIYNKEFKESNSSYQNTENLINSMLNTDIKRYKVIDNFNGEDTEIKEIDNKKYVISKTSIKIELEDKASNSMFLIPSRNISFVANYSIFINDEEIKDAVIKQSPIFINKGDTYKIIIKSNLSKTELNSLKWYQIDYDKYIETINELKKNEFNITKYNKDNHIEGNIDVNNDKNVLLLTIPYDKGWNIYVDDNKVNYDICFDSFICLDLDKGKHNIKMNYVPSWFIVGLIISSLAFIVTIIYIRKK
mgnify:CR=1 FL=1